MLQDSYFNAMEHVFDSKQNFQKKCFAEKSESLSYLVLQHHIMSDQHHKVQRHMKTKNVFQADWSTQVFLQTLVGQGQVMIHCCMKCPQILREKTLSQKFTVIALRIQWKLFTEGNAFKKCQQIILPLIIINAIIFRGQN